MKYNRVARAVFETPWYLMPTAMSAVVEILERHIDGGRFADAELAERLAIAERTAGPRAGSRMAGNVAQIGVYGVLSHRANMMTEMSGGTSVQGLTKAFRMAMADPEVAGILLDIDSPGGQVSGIPELADEIRAATKPTVAVANTLTASAAYFLASQCDEIVVTPSSLIGSIGVVMAHEDFSQMDEKAGLKTTLIYAGDNKVELYDTVPLSEDAKAYLQSLVDDTYSMFVNAVARGRGVSAATVKADFGQGRVLPPKKAVAVGMADRIDTLEGAIQRLASGRVEPRGAKAEASVPLTYPEPIAAVPVAAPEPDEVVDEVAAARNSIALAKARRRARDG